MKSAVLMLGGWKSALLFGGILALSACEEGQGPEFLQKKPEANPASVTTVPPVDGVERDVEAPDVFSANEAALWDGRPSLGGIWVAYPGVTDPQRVIIRNTENNQSIVGALFRRERDNPGPKLQVSSDAANALGMLAGAPAKLSVIALRKEAIPQAAPAPEASELPQDAPLEDADISAQDASLPATTEIEASSIDPVAAVAGAAIDNAAAASEPVAVAAAPAPTTAQRPSGQLLGMTKPFVQVGIFSVQSNADAAAETLRAGGVLPVIKEGTSGDKAIYRVVVGPSGSRADRRALMTKIKELGFADAYAVTD